MSNETSRQPGNDTGNDSLDSTSALPTRRSMRAAARSAADDAPKHDDTPEPTENNQAAEPVTMVGTEPAAKPTASALPAGSLPAPLRAPLSARFAATPAPARPAPRQSRWKSIRSMLIVAIAVPSIFGTVALPAYAFTSEETASVTSVHDTGAQSLTVPNWSRPALARDGYAATTAAELKAAAAAKAAAEAAKAAAKLAASRASASGGYYNANDTDLSAFVGGGGTWIRPVAAGISSPYGPRGLICNGSGCSNSFHDGVDFGSSCGTPIKAVSAGRVTFTGSGGAYGQRVIVDHGGGVESIYGHVQSGSFKVSVGQLVQAGTVVANVGATGVVSGCHLDLKIRLAGNFTNPVPFMATKGVRL